MINHYADGMDWEHSQITSQEDCSFTSNEFFSTTEKTLHTFETKFSNYSLFPRTLCCFFMTKCHHSCSQFIHLTLPHDISLKLISFLHENSWNSLNKSSSIFFSDAFTRLSSTFEASDAGRDWSGLLRQSYEQRHLPTADVFVKLSRTEDFRSIDS